MTLMELAGIAAFIVALAMRDVQLGLDAALMICFGAAYRALEDWLDARQRDDLHEEVRP